MRTLESHTDLIWSGVICGLIALTNLSTAVLCFRHYCMLIMFIIACACEIPGDARSRRASRRCCGT